MVRLDNYMTDGMPWQEQMVLAYVRGNYEVAVDETYDSELKEHLAKILVSTYENCRERGYVISVRYFDKQKNYAIFTHCISDCICLMMSTAYTDKPNGWDGREWSKSQHDMEFDYDKMAECGAWIVTDIKETIGKWMAEKQEEEYETKKKGLLSMLRDACKESENGEIVFGEDNPQYITACYCGGVRKERVDYFYLNSDGDVCIVTYAVEDGEPKRFEDVCSEFCVEEIEEMVKICGLL